MANQYSEMGEPVLAACCHLSVGEYQEAIQKLVKGNLVELAYATAVCTKQAINDTILKILMLKCEKNKEYDLAIDLANQMSNSKEQVEFQTIYDLRLKPSSVLYYVLDVMFRSE